MPDNTNTVQITLSVKDDGSVVIDTVKKKIDDFGDTTAQASAKGESGLKAMKAGWLELAAGVTAGYFTIKKGIDVITGLINVAAEAEQIEKRAAFQIETWGYKFQEIKPYVDAFAESIQRTTRFSGEMAQQGLGQMMQYTSNIEEAMKGVQLAMGLATQGNMDLMSAVRYVGMAMGGEVEILGRWILQLRNLDEVLGANASAAEKWAFTLGILNKMFGGAAQKDLQSYSGQLVQLENQWNDLKKVAGIALMPAAENWIAGTKSIITGLMPSIEKLKDELANLKITGIRGFEGTPVELVPQGLFDEYNQRVQDLTNRIKMMESASKTAADAAKKAAEQAAAIPIKGPTAPEKDWIKKWVADFDDLTYSYEQMGIISQKTLSENAARTLTYMESVKKAYREGKASVVDYMNAIKASNDALKKVVGEDVMDKLLGAEEDYQKRVREISREDPDRQKKVQAVIDDYFKARKEIEKMKIPVHADISPAEAELQDLIRKYQEQTINIKINVEETGGGGGANVWGIPIKDFFGEGGAEGSANIGFFGIGSSKKPITEKIREIIGEFGGLENAMTGMEAEINVAELSAQYDKLDAKLKQVERIIPDMSAMASWAGGSPYVGGPIIQTVTDLIVDYTSQMKILQMKMDYERLKTYGGSYQAGTRYVPQTGQYTLHEGERVTARNVSSNITIINHISGADDPHKIADKLTQILKYRLNGELIDLLRR